MRGRRAVAHQNLRLLFLPFPDAGMIEKIEDWIAVAHNSF